MTAFSTHPVKHITTGEGGMVVFNDAETAKRARTLRDHGMDPENRYWHIEVGYNYRLTNMQAALGVAQLERIDDIVKRKLEIAHLYRKNLSGLPGLTLQVESSETASIYWAFSFLIDSDAVGRSRADFMAALLRSGIENIRRLLASGSSFNSLEEAIEDFREFFRESQFRVFREIIGGGGTVRGFVVEKAAHYSRSEVDGIVDLAKQQLGATGLVWARRLEDGAITSSVMKALGEESVRGVLDLAQVKPGGVLFIAAGEADATSKLLGQLRLILAKKDDLLRSDDYAFTWVVDFPLLEWDPEEKRYVSMHHPFTSPHDEDMDKLESDPGHVRAKAYDLVLNGSEIGGGSIRIHDAALQSRIFSLLKIGRAHV